MVEPDFQKKYVSHIANPYNFDATYVTIPPSPLLRPYIRCFWGSTMSFNPHVVPFYNNTLIIPDTCFDLILLKNHDSGKIRLLFVGLNDRYTFDKWQKNEQDIEIFGLRFNFWALNFLTDYPMANTLNKIIAPAAIFPAIDELAERLFSVPSFGGRMALAEKYLMELIDNGKSKTHFLQCVEYMITNQGVGSLADLASYVCYSKRQLQRIFFNTLGISPKHMMNLIRYQSIWQEILQAGEVDSLSLVAKYNYADQSHFIADFKKYHSLKPQDALLAIRKNSGK